MTDVLVCGAGPAGRALSAACTDLGLSVTLVDPAPEERWPHTYALWRAELPASLGEEVVATAARGMTAFGTRAHSLVGEYCVLDNAELHRRLRRTAVREVTGTVRALEHAGNRRTVRLRDGRSLRAAVVVDATGGNRVLCGGRPARTASEQTAVGAVVDERRARPLATPERGIFMDWSGAPGSDGSWPSFLYAVPWPGGRMLLEETALARRPGLPLSTLRGRLRNRLRAAGVPLEEGTHEERVRFALDDPVPESRRTVPFGLVPFGASAGLIHPATGFSVATVLRLAPLVAGALSDGLEHGPVSAARAARSVLWPGAARLNRALQLCAAEGLLAMPPEVVPRFFDVFFTISAERRHSFLTSTSDPAGSRGAMVELFRRSPWWLRHRLVRGGLLGRGVRASDRSGGTRAEARP
ncbi:lycopene cyclase family protein [Actinopolyspora saharensis]|uniref:Lycopene cyclase (CrtL-type) n=1 Tax=Actinopolyspora saharensis TaxID=995062 RepID=A0A1H0YAM4_9ACTN|nr:lycopene cyclase family protein [Actinopolyspora saharensis]SDQ12279.1 lycopene cyclase (CrtL-type) [Actinopolyspora saharensis]